MGYCYGKGSVRFFGKIGGKPDVSIGGGMFCRGVIIGGNADMIIVLLSGEWYEFEEGGVGVMCGFPKIE